LAPVDQGVPQGALLGPRFYSSHANDLPEVVAAEPNDNAEMFADDTTAFCDASDIDILTTKLQHLCNNMSNWAEKNGMVIHPGKTKVLILSPKMFFGPVQAITMDDRSLEIVNHHSVLGVTVDNKLSWNIHTENTTKQFNTKVKKLKRMRSVGSETLSDFYYKAIIPSVTYNISVWGSCSMKSRGFSNDF